MCFSMGRRGHQSVVDESFKAKGPLCDSQGKKRLVRSLPAVSAKTIPSPGWLMMTLEMIPGRAARRCIFESESSISMLVKTLRKRILGLIHSSPACVF
jgi:hypothetical protein